MPGITTSLSSIAQQQMDHVAVLGGDRERLRRISGREHYVPAALESLPHQRPHLVVVLDQQHGLCPVRHQREHGRGRVDPRLPLEFLHYVALELAAVFMMLFFLSRPLRTSFVFRSYYPS